MSRLQTNAIRHLGSAVDNLTLDNAGRVLLPNQPKASVTWNASQPPNDYIGRTTNSGDVNINVGSCFNASTGLFTCPVAGVYRMSFSGMNLGAAQGFVYAKKNNGSIGYGDSHSSYSPAVQYARNVISTFVTCAANDTLGFWNQVGYTNVHSGYGQMTFELVG